MIPQWFQEGRLRPPFLFCFGISPSVAANVSSRNNPFALIPVKNPPLSHERGYPPRREKKVYLRVRIPRISGKQYEPKNRDWNSHKEAQAAQNKGPAKEQSASNGSPAG